MQNSLWGAESTAHEYTEMVQLFFQLTRKSSCVNARSIPTAAYQVLHLLSCTRWGTPPLGYPPPARSDGGRGYLRWVPPGLGTPPARSDWGGYLRWGTPIGVPPWPCLMGVGGLPEVGYPPGQVWWGEDLRWGTPPGWLDLAGVPPPPPPRRCGMTNKVKLLPSLSYYVRGR